MARMRARSAALRSHGGPRYRGARSHADDARLLVREPSARSTGSAGGSVACAGSRRRRRPSIDRASSPSAPAARTIAATGGPSSSVAAAGAADDMDAVGSGARDCVVSVGSSRRRAGRGAAAQERERLGACRAVLLEAVLALERDDRGLRPRAEQPVARAGAVAEAQQPALQVTDAPRPGGCAVAGASREAGRTVRHGRRPRDGSLDRPAVPARVREQPRVDARRCARVLGHRGAWQERRDRDQDREHRDRPRAERAEWVLHGASSSGARRAVMESPRRTALARPRGLARPFDEEDEGDGSRRGGRAHEDARRLGERRESGEEDGEDGG